MHLKSQFCWKLGSPREIYSVQIPRKSSEIYHVTYHVITGFHTNNNKAEEEQASLKFKFVCLFVCLFLISPSEIRLFHCRIRCTFEMVNTRDTPNIRLYRASPNN